MAEGVAFTRELVTEPANIIYPETFVERCRGLADLDGTGEVVSGIVVMRQGENAVVARPKARGQQEGSTTTNERPRSPVRN